MSELLKNIDARTRLAGTNKLEILLFTLGVDARTGRRETFGINVFKVREVMRTPAITAAPDMPDAVQGMVSLRGALVPVVDLGAYVGVGADARREIMIVTEYNGHTQGFQLLLASRHVIHLESQVAQTLGLGPGRARRRTGKREQLDLRSIGQGQVQLP